MQVFRMRRMDDLCPNLVVTGLRLDHSSGSTSVGDTGQPIYSYLRGMQRENIQQWWWPFENGGARVYS